jgi:hypothetical protein
VDRDIGQRRGTAKRSNDPEGTGRTISQKRLTIYSAGELQATMLPYIHPLPKAWDERSGGRMSVIGETVCLCV